MLAYLFWHWPQVGVELGEYEAAMVGFHGGLAAGAPVGFRRSLTVRVGAAPWLVGGTQGYEDWYVVDDSAALDPLNEAAVSGARRGPHDRAAYAAAGGAGGLYRFQRGDLDLAEAGVATWLSKPGGMSYAEFDARLREWIGDTPVALWQRQMVLGPAWEFCLLSRGMIEVPEEVGALVVGREVVVGAGS